MKASLIPALLAAALAVSIPTPSLAEGVLVQWEKIYNGPGNGEDQFDSAAVDSAGNVIVTGVESQNGGVGWGPYTAKYAAASGALLWERRHTNGDGGFLAVDKADNVIVCGNLYNNFGTTDIYVTKYAAANGGLMWEKRYSGISNEGAGIRNLALDEAGNVIINANSPGAGDIDMYTAKYTAADGMLVWENRYNGMGIGKADRATGLAVDRDGNAMVTGFSDGDPRGPHYTAKYAAAGGALIWEKHSSNPSRRATGRSVAVDSEGNAIIIGASPRSSLATLHNGYTAKYAAEDGALIWEVFYEAPGWTDWPHQVKVDAAGNAVVTGHSQYGSPNRPDNDMYTAKFAAANGALLWEQRYDGPGVASEDDPREFVLDQAGNAIVTGSSGSRGSLDILTVKYAAADGALLWEKRYKGAGQCIGMGVTVDRHGSTIVTGFITRTDGNRDAYLAKYVEDADRDGLPDWWEIEHFGSTEGQGALDDTDGDGAVELLELAFGTDPRSPASVPAPVAVIEDGYLTTTIAKQPCVRYLVETSATLDGGFSAASTTILIDDAATLKVRDNVPIGIQPERFLRVQVTAAF